MDKVKRLIKAGASIPGAIREALGMTVEEFSAKYDRPPTHVSAVINGKRAPVEADIDAFVAAQGGTPDEWRELLWLAGRPANASSTAA